MFAEENNVHAELVVKPLQCEYRPIETFERRRRTVVGAANQQHLPIIQDQTSLWIISVVIPVYNESESLVALHEQITKNLKEIGGQYEIIFVDDGSTDDSHAGDGKPLPARPGTR